MPPPDTGSLTAGSLRQLLFSTERPGRLQTLQQAIFFRRDLSYLDYAFIRRTLESEQPGDLSKPLLTRLAKCEKKAYRTASALRVEVLDGLPLLPPVGDALLLDGSRITGPLRQMVTSTSTRHLSLRSLIRRLWEGYTTGDNGVLQESLDEIQRVVSAEHRDRVPGEMVSALSSLYGETKEDQHRRETRARRDTHSTADLLKYFSFAGALVAHLLGQNLTEESTEPLVEFSCWLLGVIYVMKKFDDTFGEAFKQVFGNHVVLG